MPAIQFAGTEEQIIQLVVDCLAKLPRVEIISRKSNYLHAVFRSLVFRFADDVEFYADGDKHQLHFRSASRLGYSDLGANRKRMKQLSKNLRGSSC